MAAQDDASGSAGAGDYPAVRARVLGESLAADRVLLIGEVPAAKELVAADPDRFLLEEAAGRLPEAGFEVLALSLERQVLDRARTVAAGQGRDAVHALVEPAPGEADPVAAVRAELAARGLALVGLRRLYWPLARGGGPRSRAQRIAEETRELLIGLVAADSDRLPVLLSEELERLERELAVTDELRVEQQLARAATEQRLAEARAGGRQLEADRRRLEEQLALLRAELDRATQRLQEARRALEEAARQRRRRRLAWLRKLRRR